MSDRHPTPRELREWKRRLEAGQASTGMLDRVIEGYEALWRVMRASQRVVGASDRGYNVIVEDWDLRPLERLDVALAPFEDLEPEQMELEP